MDFITNNPATKKKPKQTPATPFEPLIKALGKDSHFLTPRIWEGGRRGKNRKLSILEDYLRSIAAYYAITVYLYGRMVTLSPGDAAFNAQWASYETGLDIKWIRKMINVKIAQGQLKPIKRASRFTVVRLVPYDKGIWTPIKEGTHTPQNDPKRELISEKQGSHKTDENPYDTADCGNNESEMGTHGTPNKALLLLKELKETEDAKKRNLSQ